MKPVLRKKLKQIHEQDITMHHGKYGKIIKDVDSKYGV